MLIRDAGQLSSFQSLDSCRIKELIHPDRTGTHPGVSVALAEVDPGQGTVPHRLNVVEIYHILSGRGRMHQGEETSEVAPGQTVYIPSGMSQWIENAGDITLTFLCICHPAYDPGGDIHVGTE